MKNRKVRAVNWSAVFSLLQLSFSWRMKTQTVVILPLFWLSQLW